MRLLLTLFFSLSGLFIITISAQNDSVAPPVNVGDYYEGGIVFYINGTGQHGLIAAPNDQARKVQWGGNGITGANSASDGDANTRKIIEYFDKNSPDTKIAVRYCDTLMLNGYTDWYLPAIMELRRMYQTQDVIGGFALGDYSSSSEYGREDAYHIHFRPHHRVEFYYNKVAFDYNIRCIRKF